MGPRSNVFEFFAAEVSARRPKMTQAAICAACPTRVRGGFCAHLDAPTLASLAQRSHRVVLDRHTEVEPTGLSVVIQGVLSEVHINRNGARRILGVTFPGEPVPPRGESDGIADEAATPVILCRISAASYHRTLSQSHEMRTGIYTQARTKQDRARQHAAAIALLSPEQRIASFIVECTRFMPWQPLSRDGGVLSMVLDRQDIAAFLATSAETVCRVLHRMQDCGILRLRDARTYEIDDLNCLRSITQPILPEGRPILPPHPVCISGRETMTAVNADCSDES